MARENKARTVILTSPELKKQLKVMAIELETTQDVIVRACMAECMPEGLEYIKNLIISHKITSGSDKKTEAPTNE